MYSDPYDRIDDPRKVELYRERDRAQAAILAAERAIKMIDRREVVERFEARARVRRRDFDPESS